MLKNAYLYEEEIKRKSYEIWYDPKYQYYYSGPYHGEFSLNHDNDGDWSSRTFASVNSKGEVIGYMGYHINHEINGANSFGALNFSNDKITFGLDLAQCIDDIFCKFCMNRLEFNVIVGNPIERSYDRMVQKYGGRILCVRKQTAKDIAGNLLDDKVYEIVREDYLKVKEKINHGK